MPAETDARTSIEDLLYRDYGCEHKAGDVIFREGEEGRQVYIIRDGRVEISKTVGGSARVLAVLSRGEFFGEMALISERPRSATARAIEDCRLLALQADIFFRILRSNYEITMRIIEQLAARLAEADRRLETLLLADATSRLIQHLEGNRGAAGAPVAQMAGELAVPLERLLRIVGKLQEKGIIVDRGGTIHPADPEKLEKLKKRLLLSEEVQPTE